MVLTNEQLGEILKARSDAELKVLELLRDVRMDDLANLTGILSDLDKISCILHEILMSK